MTSSFDRNTHHRRINHIILATIAHFRTNPYGHPALVAAFCCERDLMQGQHEVIEKAALEIDNIAKPFPDDLEIQHERISVWCIVAYVRSRTQGQHEATARAVREVDDIARPFPNDPKIQSYRADAWSNVAYASSRISELHKVAANAVGEVKKIAIRFPQHPEIQDCWAKVLGYIRTNK